jgi:hypothetical protein
MKASFNKYLVPFRNKDLRLAGLIASHFGFQGALNFQRTLKKSAENALGRLRRASRGTTHSLLLQSDGYSLIGAVDVSVMGITDLGDEKSERKTIGRGRLEQGIRLGHNLKLTAQAADPSASLRQAGEPLALRK